MEDNLIKVWFSLDELKREYKNMFPFQWSKNILTRYRLL